MPSAATGIDLLISGGVVAEPLPVEAMEEHSGSPLTTDDLLDFVLWLGKADLISEAASQAGAVS